MKTLKQISNILLGITIFAYFSYTATAQERKDSVEKIFRLKSTGSFSFSCFDTDLKINTWNKDEVKFTGKIFIQGGKKEHQDELIDVFKNPEVVQRSNSLEIKTNMAKNTIMLGPLMKITLVSGKVIKVNKYKVHYTLWIPESIFLKLTSKYNEIEIANLKGMAQLELYDVELTASDFGEKSKINMKYSNASIGKFGTTELDIYDSDMEIKSIRDGIISSKYSEIYIDEIEDLQISSYDDDYKIGKINNLNLDAKYGEFKIQGDMITCKFSSYDSDFYFKNIDELDFSGKYTSIETADVKTIKIKELYDSEIKAGKVEEFTCHESKYDDIKIESVAKSIYMPDMYSSEIKVWETEAGFERFEGNFKYGAVKIKLNPLLDFKLDFETRYSEVLFPEENFNYVVKIKEDEEYTLKGSTKENAKCNIKFNAYNTDFNFK